MAGSMAGSIDRCRVCGGDAQRAFAAKVLSRHEVQYFLCPVCSHLQTEAPHWLEEAYGSAIQPVDTGLVWRTNMLVSRVSALLDAFFDIHGTFLDHAGGYGLFVRAMRDVGFDFRWRDRYAPNLLARGFDWKDGARAELITAIEVFEHFVDPMTEIQRLFEDTDSVLFTTELRPEAVPAPESWWYYGFEHGQHIAFYSRTSLQWIAGKLGLRLLSDSGVHLLTRRTINPRRYALLMRWAHRLYPVALRGRLQPRMSSDFEQLKSTGAKP